MLAYIYDWAVKIMQPFLIKDLFKKLLSPYLCNPETEKLPEVLGSVVQLVRMPPCHGGGRGFESRPVRKNEHNPLIFNGFFHVYTSVTLWLHTFYLVLGHFRGKYPI